VQDLNDRLNIPRRLSDLGVDPARIDELVEKALEDPTCGGNPVKLTAENVRRLFEESL